MSNFSQRIIDDQEWEEAFLRESIQALSELSNFDELPVYQSVTELFDALNADNENDVIRTGQPK